MKIPETIKTKMSEYYTHGDHTKLKRYGITKKKYFSLVTIGKAFKEGECKDELLDVIDEFYNLKIKNSLRCCLRNRRLSRARYIVPVLKARLLSC